MDGLEEAGAVVAAAVVVVARTGRGGSGFVLAHSFSSAAISEVELGSSEVGTSGLNALQIIIYT